LAAGETDLVPKGQSALVGTEWLRSTATVEQKLKALVDAAKDGPVTFERFKVALDKITAVKIKTNGPEKSDDGSTENKLDSFRRWMEEFHVGAEPTGGNPLTAAEQKIDT